MRRLRQQRSFRAFGKDGVGCEDGEKLNAVFGGESSSARADCQFSFELGLAGADFRAKFRANRALPIDSSRLCASA